MLRHYAFSERIVRFSGLHLRTPTHVDAAKYFFGSLRKIDLNARYLEVGERRELSNMAMLLAQAKASVDLT